MGLAVLQCGVIGSFIFLSNFAEAPAQWPVILLGSWLLTALDVAGASSPGGLECSTAAPRRTPRRTVSAGAASARLTRSGGRTTTIRKPKDDSGKVVLKVNDEYNWTMELPVTFHVEVRASDTIADVKAVIQDYIRVPMINQRLRDVNNNICSDRTVLGDLKKKKVSMEIVTSSSSRQRSRTPRRSRTPPGSWK